MLPFVFVEKAKQIFTNKHKEIDIFWFAISVCPLSKYVNTSSGCKRKFLLQICMPAVCGVFAHNLKLKKDIAKTLYPSFFIQFLK